MQHRTKQLEGKITIARTERYSLDYANRSDFGRPSQMISAVPDMPQMVPEVGRRMGSRSDSQARTLDLQSVEGGNSD